MGIVAAMDAEYAKVWNGNSKLDVLTPGAESMYRQVGLRPLSGIQYDDGKVSGTLYGGPYANKPSHMKGVCMAEELLRLSHDVAIPTRDFSVPDPKTMVAGMLQARELLRDFPHVYVGCMGGVGRTGLFLGAMHLFSQMAQVWLPAQASMAEQSIRYVRNHYKGHAIETREQEHFLRVLPLRWAALKAKMGAI